MVDKYVYFAYGIKFIKKNDKRESVKTFNNKKKSIKINLRVYNPMFNG